MSVFMKELQERRRMTKGENGDSVSARGGRRTRSQVAPDWTVTESLILVNEIAAVEADCSAALSSYQQWEIIAGNCAALDIGRNLGQCRRKWHALLDEYHNRGGPLNLDPELFEAIQRVVKARQERQQVDPESDPEPVNEDLDATLEIGSRRKRQQSKSERHRIPKPMKCQPVESSENLSEKQDQRDTLEQRSEESHEDEPENHHSEEEYLKDFLEDKSKMKHTAKRPPKSIEMPLKSLAEAELHENHDVERPKLSSRTAEITISREEVEKALTLKLQELGIEIHEIGAESAEAGSHNVEDDHTEFRRRQGDKFIASLGNFNSTLEQLCDLLQDCK